MLKPSKAANLEGLYRNIGATLQRVPCLDGGGQGEGIGVGPPAWTSDTPSELEGAALACGPCPVLLLCREAGRREVAGVWGGVVREREMYREPAAKPGTPKGPSPSRVLMPNVLIALATRSAPATPDDISDDLDGIAPIGVIRMALAHLVAAGDATRALVGTTKRRTYRATTAGTESAEQALVDGRGSAS